MPTAYINDLNKDLLEVAEQAPAAKPDLRQRFVEWYVSLPTISRYRPFAMVEFEQALATQGKYLSPVLLGLGWQRKRRWTSPGQYNRYWEPPGLNA